MESKHDMSGFMKRTDFCINDNERLKLFVGGDFSPPEKLSERSHYLSILKDKHQEILGLLPPLQGVNEDIGEKTWKCDQCKFSTDSERGILVHIGRLHKPT